MRRCRGRTKLPHRRPHGLPPEPCLYRAAPLQTHDLPVREYRLHQKQLRLTDTRLDEQSHGMSIKAMPVSLVREGGGGGAEPHNQNPSLISALSGCQGDQVCEGGGRRRQPH